MQHDPRPVSSLPPPTSRRDRAIVLVHGAWVGEWCWAPVLPLLEASGRPVVAVSLTGHGMRRAGSGPHIDLADHVDDLVAALEVLDLTRATVVGHSYGGRVITKAWPRIADRTARLVYLDAHAPVGDVVAPPVAAGPDGMIPFGGYDPDPDVLGGQAALAWFLARVVPQSARAMNAPFVEELPDDLRRCYVAATANPNPRFRAYAAAAALDPRWEHVELPGDHWLMFSHPGQVAEIVLDETGASS
jgi:pimeloyl-ACP methyl ester carboxylesterase